MAFFQNILGRGGKNERNKHVEELMSKVPGVTSIDSTNSKFQCMLSSPAGGQGSSITITLLEQYPKKAPIVSITGPLEHPWIDKYRFVAGCASLNHWTDTSSLSEIISEIKVVLEAGYDSNAPRNAISEVTSINPYSGQADCRQQQTQQQQTQASVLQPSQEQVIEERYEPFPDPEIPTSFPVLNELSEEQLQRLLDDEVAFDILVQDSFKDERLDSLVALQTNNVVMSRENLRKDGEISELKCKVQSLQVELAGLCESYQASLAVVQSNDGGASISKEHILSKLADKVNKLEEKSDTLGQSFMDGNTDLQTFLRDYHSLQKGIYTIKGKKRAAGL
jgi:ubiquitin-protein ligase